LPDARDVLPNIQLAELDARKLSDYSLKPGHPGNNGKADGWRALGYDVDNTDGRRDAARELRGLICDELLARGKVAETRDTAYGPSHRVLSGLTGPNGRHATLVTCWRIFDGRTIPAGMKGTVLEARPDGSCLAEFAFAPQTADSDGDFVQGILTRDQYEVIES
jgi:hypothetical protein